MKIGIVLPATPGYSETFFTNKIKGLESHGHTVVLYVNAAKSGAQNKTTVKVAPNLSGNFVAVTVMSSWLLFKSFLFHFSATKKMWQLDSKDGYSFGRKIKNIIINSHLLSEKLDWLHFGFGTMVFDRENVAQAIGSKMAISFRGFDIGIYPLKHPNCYQKTWDKVDKIHVISDDIANLVVKNGCVAKQKIVKICPAIDSDYFATTEFEKFDSEIKMISIARLHWKKGLEYTLEALAIVNQKGINFHYTIIGDGNEMERLQFAVHQLGLVRKVTFAGKLSSEDVKNKLQTANLYLQYSNQEGFCNAVLEAQAMGKICIVSDADGLQENIIDGVTGFVVSKRNPLSLSNKIIEVNSLDRNEKFSLSNAAAKRVRTQFTLEKQMEQFIAFYDS